MPPRKSETPRASGVTQELVNATAAHSSSKPGCVQHGAPKPPVAVVIGNADEFRKAAAALDALTQGSERARKRGRAVLGKHWRRFVAMFPSESERTTIIHRLIAQQARGQLPARIFASLSDEEFQARLAASREKRAQHNVSGDNSVTADASTAATNNEQPPQTQPQPLTLWTSERPRKRAQKLLQQRERAPNVQSEPPHSVDAEQGVLGSIICEGARQPAVALATLAEVRSRITKQHFYVPAHGTIFEVLCDMDDAGKALDLITVTDELRSKALLDSVGGAHFVTSLFTFVPTAANVEYYLDSLIEKFARREAIADGTRLVRAAYAEHDDDEFMQLVQSVSSRLLRINGATSSTEKFEIDALQTFDARHDPNMLVGHRWLVRGGTFLWAGGSGYGKSTLEMQLAIYWACGAKCFGMCPVRPLKSLIVEAENDRGDMAEQLQGIWQGIAATKDLNLNDSKALIVRNLSIHRECSGKTGRAFLGMLDLLIQHECPDLVWIDPLFAFAGCDLMDSEKTGRFLREGLFPIAARRNVALMVLHHVGKPARGKKADAEIAEIDYQYLGFGTSEIQNAFRAVNVLVPISGTQLYKLVLSKRGERAGAKDIEGEFTRTLFLEHSREGICWLQAAKPDAAPGGRASFTKDDLKAVVPRDEPMLKNVLLEKRPAGMGEKTARAYLAQLVAERELFEYGVKRTKTNPQIWIARHEPKLL